MFFHIIDRFLTRTHNIVHFGATLNILKHIYVYTQSYIHTHTTYIHTYIQTDTYTYILIHTYTYISTLGWSLFQNL